MERRLRADRHTLRAAASSLLRSLHLLHCSAHAPASCRLDATHACAAVSAHVPHFLPGVAPLFFLLAHATHAARAQEGLTCRARRAPLPVAHGCSTALHTTRHTARRLAAAAARMQRVPSLSRIAGNVSAASARGASGHGSQAALNALAGGADASITRSSSAIFRARPHRAAARHTDCVPTPFIRRKC
jgi:hypothetical protein